MPMITLVLATRNRHKADEIQTILSGPFHFLTLNHFMEAPEIDEDAPTFAGNASKKAGHIAAWLSRRDDWPPLPNRQRRFVLADDSGLEVDALNGAPGVHSARFAALDTRAPGNSSDAENNAKLLRLLEPVPWEKRSARFKCVLALAPIPELSAENRSPADQPPRPTELFEGICEGRLALAPAGQGGFGYDPLFIPDGYDQSFAELGQEIKNRISHRAQALRKLKTRLETTPSA